MKYIYDDMKYIITEQQYKILMEEEQEVLYIPSIELFGDWNALQKYLERKGNRPYSIGGDLNLYRTPIESLGSLTSVRGNLDLRETPIKSLGNLTSVGGYLDLYGTPISKKYTEEEIRQMIDVRGEIYM